MALTRDHVKSLNPRALTRLSSKSHFPSRGNSDAPQKGKGNLPSGASSGASGGASSGGSGSASSGGSGGASGVNNPKLCTLCKSADHFAFPFASSHAGAYTSSVLVTCPKKNDFSAEIIKSAWDLRNEKLSKPKAKGGQKA